MGLFWIILLVAVCVCGPWISRWSRQRAAEFAARRAEDYMRRMMGMPSRKEEERARRQSRNTGRASERKDKAGWADQSYSRRGRRHRPARYRAADLMRAVAVDVEYTEIREYSSATIAADGARVRVETEEQVTDVKFTELKI